MMRVRNVTATGFEYRIGEWEYLDGANSFNETVIYMVVEKGAHPVGGIKIDTAPVSPGVTAGTNIQKECFPYRRQERRNPAKAIHKCATTYNSIPAY
jgi:hypothetical protein